MKNPFFSNLSESEIDVFKSLLEKIFSKPFKFLEYDKSVLEKLLEGISSSSFNFS